MNADFKGLQGHYAGFVSRSTGLIIDLALVILIIGIINGSIALTLDLFLGLDVSNCPAIDVDFQDVVLGGFVCHAANWLRVAMSLFTNPVYFALFWTLGGQTLGQYITGVRVVRLDGKRLNFGRSLVRWVGYIVALVPLGLGFLWCLWDDRRQTFSDKMAKTVVLYAWKAQQNEFLLDRVWSRLRRRKRLLASLPGASMVLPVGAPAASLRPVRLELVQVELPIDVAARGGGAIRVLADAVRRGDVNIITSTVLVKDETGRVGYVGSSDLATGDRSIISEAIVASDPRLSTLNLEQLMSDVPAGRAIWSIIVEDKYLVAVLTTLTAAKVSAKVFDLDTPAHDPVSVGLIDPAIVTPYSSEIL
jgi:uncharacterized RDD family membrane protein YckC